MTVAPSIARPGARPGAFALAPSDDGLLPRRERAALIAAICALHLGGLAAFGAFGAHFEAVSPIDVDLVAKGDYFVDTIAVAGPPAEKISPTPPTPDPDPNPPDPTPEPAKVEPPPAVEAPQAVETPAPAVEPPPAVDDAAERAARREKAEKQREQRLIEKRREAREEQKRREKRREAHSPPQGGSEAHRAGAANGAASAGARANYGAIVAAELNRHKFYPPAARAAGETGSVGVVFAIGPSGRVTSHAITSSSGSAALDAAVRHMMATAHAPPPPGGGFRGSITINFNLNH